MRHIVWTLSATALIVTVAVALPAQAGPIGQGLGMACSKAGGTPLGEYLLKIKKEKDRVVNPIGDSMAASVSQAGRMLPGPAGQVVIDANGDFWSGVRGCP